MLRCSRALLAAGKRVGTFPTKPYKLHLADETDFAGPNSEIQISKEEAEHLLKEMQIIRKIEQKSYNLYQKKKIRGFCHLYSGQEAVCSGMQAALTMKDAVITAYRDHGWHIVRKGTPREVIAEQMGKYTGCSKGKGGSMHLYRAETNFFGGNGIVGAQVPLGAGLAFKYAYKNNQRPEAVSVSLFGDGAANQGQLFEAYNMAALWKLPAIFVCENNLYGMGTSVERASANTEFYRRCDYIPGIRANGWDLPTIKEATRYAKEWCMNGRGPIMIEFQTYRFFGHSMSDPGDGYRQQSEIEGFKTERDCIKVFADACIEQELFTREEVDGIIAKANDEAAVEIAEGENSPDPPMWELTTDVYDGKYTLRNCDFRVPFPVAEKKTEKPAEKQASQ